MLGSADGYSTEAPKRLHINYTKDAYRASNKHNYTIQMVNWLRRQEVVDFFDSYLEWVSGCSSTSNELETSSELNKSGQIIIQTSPSGSIPAVQLWIANNHLLELRNIQASQIISDYHAGQFIPALTTYLRANHCKITPQLFDTFDLSKRVSIDLPIIPETGSSHCADVFRVIASVPHKARRPEEPGHFDFVLVWTNE
ncbi:hypothetical protein BC835DRAFT_1421211 [Cytidiella melzeri]|nr:hypothetical protein BC835DRAFT_1421211 [Cytidiella melzeri]